MKKTKSEIKEWLSTSRISPEMKVITIDMGTKCTLMCLNCTRNTYRNMGIPPGGYGRDITPEDFKKILKYYDIFSFNGQLSDSILNPHLKTILEMMKEKIPKDQMYLSSVHTAATAKHLKEDYYVKLFNANPDIRWIFGIDGLPGESEQYRVNQNSSFLLRMATIASEMGIPTTWQYIAFSFNEDSIEKAKEIAKVWDITLEIIASSRWSDENDPRRPKHDLYKGEYLSWDYKDE